MRNSSWAVVGGVAVLAVVGAGVALDRGLLQFNYPSEARYPIRGIDVSHHQGTIEWPAVRRSGVSFAYLKATEGGDFVDPLFTSNWNDAQAAGLAVGEYHYFTFCREAALQAKHFITIVPRTSGALPPVVDLEFGGNCATIPAPAKLRTDLAAFVEELHAHYGQQPVLYVTREFYDAYLRDVPAPGGLWVRDVFRLPRWVQHDGWTLWQYANRGSVPGIEGAVDLNVFNGDASAWERFRQRTPL
jgi:lysozyme